MRTALLAALKRTETGEVRALIPLVGRSVLGWQIDLVISMGCERVICLCEATGPKILSLQQECEAHGTEFHAIRGITQLLALLRADEELIVLMDGLMVDSDAAKELLPPSEKLPKAVFSREPDSATEEVVPEDFERIDSERYWAGILAMRGDRAQQLADMPSDSDAISLLLRVALQSSARIVAVPETAFEAGHFFLASSSEAVESRQRQLIKASAPKTTWTGPAQALATLTGRHLELSGVSNGAALSAGVGAILLVAGVSLAWLGYGAIGLALAALGAFSGASASSLMRLRARLFGREQNLAALSGMKMATFTGAVVATLGALNPSIDQIELVASPFFAFGLVFLASMDGGGSARGFWSDLALQLGVLSAAAALGFLSEANVVLGLAALGYKLLRLRRN